MSGRNAPGSAAPTAPSGQRPPDLAPLTVDTAGPWPQFAGCPLRPCPFCGGAARVEPHAWVDESVRIACGSAGCPVRPATEYLLARYSHELRTAWNTRAPAVDGGRVNGEWTGE